MIRSLAFVSGMVGPIAGVAVPEAVVVRTFLGESPDARAWPEPLEMSTYLTVPLVHETLTGMPPGQALRSKTDAFH